ncbi:MAG: UvrB/UvrC motif-containing protein [Candidatus Omnitrophica bacterium]|nr:UvrB/UvrC motif-containing protein [Candidatus Omnitrophota bacterium]MBU1852981.1 UvrB/UvrC motif-containing protein [Candidatus Omnitrophota bacterium]
MQCDICGQNQATVHLTEIIDEKMTELHLCEECAQKKGAQMESHFGLADLLAGLADLGGEFTKTKKETKIKCPRCGLTYEDFKKVGRLGCGDCYQAFKDALLPLLKRIHGSTQHYGKSPGRVANVVKAKTDLQTLKDRLQRAIQQEEFEEAAKLRDKIREIEKKKSK